MSAAACATSACPTEAFLSAIRKGPGMICTHDGGNWREHPFTDYAEALSLIERFKSDRDIYVTMGTLRAEAKGRKRKDVKELNGLFLDLDCHDKSGDYADTVEALSALKVFYRNANLPKPAYLVSSGHGLHAHWSFTTPLSVDEWEALAGKLKRLTKLLGLKADPTVTADPARVLRVPGTFNFRDRANPVEVELVEVPGTAPLTPSAVDAALDKALATHAGHAASAQIAPLFPPARMQSAQDRVKLAKLIDALEHISSDVPRGCGTIIGSDGEPVQDYWLGVILACRRAFGDEVKERVRDWSKHSELYTEAGFEQAWQQYNPHHPKPVTVASVFKLAEWFGWKGRQGSGLAFLPDSSTYRLLDRAAILDQPPLRWRIKGLFPETGVGAIYGPSGSGKSFLAFDLGVAIARGAEWFGRKTKAGPVTYVILEGEAGLRNRFRAWEQHAKAEVPDTFAAIAQPFNLAEPAQVEALGAILPNGGVVIIDTLNRAAPGLDENSSVDMGRILSGTKRLQAITGGLVLIVHHTGKDSSKGLRGHSSLFAALDGAIEVERNERVRRWSAAKVKDGEDGLSVPFRLAIVELGIDADGDKIRSCAVVRDTAAIFTKPPPSGGNQRQALSAIKKALAASATLGEAGAGPNTQCMRCEDAISEAANALNGIEKKRRRGGARTAVQGLLRAGYLRSGLDEQGNEWIWL